MVIKKFQAKTEAEAIVLAKKELGDDITVIHSRNVKPKGFFSFFKKMQVEITVAKDEEDVKRDTDNIKEGVAAIDAARAAAEERAAARESASEKKVREKPAAPQEGRNIDLKADSKADSLAVEARLDNIQSLLEQKLSMQEKERKAEPQKIKEEKDDAKTKELMDFTKLLYNTLIDNEVDEKFANELIGEVEQNFGSNVNVEHILSHIYQKVILKFGKPETIEQADKGAKAVFFIGPTGVGKTTTLAKLASRFKLTDNKRIALFTTDTYRISATDQLKTYANIMGVPFHVIYTPEELLEEYERYKEYDYILIDTAGHSPHNTEQKEDMEKFIHVLDGVAQTENYLVLSATTKYKDLLKICDVYREMTGYRLIFTKLDETECHGNLLNVRMHTMAPMSYVTNGQNVPDDIEVFNPQNAVKRLLGG